MNINLDRSTEPFAVNAYGSGWIEVGEHRVDQPCALTSTSLTTDNLPPHPRELVHEHFVPFIADQPEIILLGTGAEQVFIDFAVVESLAQSGVALEIMDTGAACRLFNILLAEARPSVAVLYPA